MERLTIEYCGEYVPKEMCSIDRLGGADDCDLCCEYCKATEDGNKDCRGCAINQCFNKLGEYETLEEQGKLMKIPCAIGDTLYRINKGKKEPVIPMRVIGIAIRNENELIIQTKDIDDDNHNIYSQSNVGKTVFSTKEEADAALEELLHRQRLLR